MAHMPQTRPISAELTERANRVSAAAAALKPKPWDRAAAAELCEQSQDLADEVVELERDDLAESLLGYAAYLSSFVDGSLVPNVEQAAQLKALGEAVSEAIERLRQRAPVTDLLQAPSVMVSSAPEICLVGIDRGRASVLGGALTTLGLRCSVARSANAQLEKLLRDEVLAAAVDRRALGAWQTLLDRAIAVEPNFTRPPTLSVGPEDRLEWRLDAMRGGAEGFYVLPAEMPRVARRLADLVHDRTAPYRVLIVDDDRSITMFCDAVLRHNGMETKTLNQPMEIFTVLADFEPDVILVDLYMPEVNGLELLALLRSNARTLFTPVIVLSGDGDVERRFDALHLGGDDYLTKPIRPRFLVAAVTNRARRARWVRREMEALRDA